MAAQLLSSLTLTSPYLPPGTTAISVDTSALPLTVSADLNTIGLDVLVNGVLTQVDAYTSTATSNVFSALIPLTPSSASQIVEINGRNYSSTVTPATPSTSPVIQFSLIYIQSGLATIYAPPSGITVYKGSTTCLIEWAIPTYVGLQGVRVQYSTDPSGITTPYTQFGNLQTALTRTADVTLVGPTITTASQAITPLPGQAATNIITETSTSTTVTVNYCSANIPYSLINANPFYVVLSTVVLDPTTNQIFESQLAGPFLCGFVNLGLVSPTDFPALEQAVDIASRMITSVNQSNPDLDLTARSEIRDTIINPIAIEMANMSVRSWFSKCASSISAISQIDDANGDGISDPYATSAVKQKIGNAYGLSSTDTQSFIDRRFDILGEQAGVVRGGATFAVVSLTFYVYTVPTAPITISSGVVCTTIPNSTTTTSVSFVTRASATIDPRNLAAYYDPSNGWYSVTIPAEAVVAGSSGQVGAGTIRQVQTGGPAGLAVTNLLASTDGTDSQSNSAYAAMIQNRLVVGKDNGSKNGYTNTALSISGIVGVDVQGANDLDMVRDWSAILDKHTYGCVDIYAKGTTTSQQSDAVPFVLNTSSTYGAYSTYLNATLVNPSSPSFKITGFSTLNQEIYTIVEMVATSAGKTIWLGTVNAQVDNVGGIIYLNPNDLTYVINADGSTTTWQINGVNATNLMFMQSLGTTSQVVFQLFAQYGTGISYIPSLQPVTAVDSVSGNITGVINPSLIELVYTSDFLLTGGSNTANDQVFASPTTSVPLTKTITLNSAVTPIDSNIDLTVSTSGQIGNILSVRSADLSTIYTFGIDYSIVASGRYATYSLNVLNDPITGLPRIPIVNNNVIVAYYSYLFQESLTLQSESLTMTATLPQSFTNAGYVGNTWMPAAHGDTTLLLDASLIAAGVSPESRYVKVTYYNGTTTDVMLEGKDFTLQSGTYETITRVVGGGIPDGGSVVVSYYTNEVFTIVTEYPSFVQELVAAVAVTKNAGADVVVKAMVSNAVDLTFSVVLNPNTTPAVMDPLIRTVLSNALYQADTSFNQSDVFAGVMGINGVVNVKSPLLKCAKADGSYDIGVVIPTGTSWSLLTADPLFQPLLPGSSSFISALQLVPNPTLPSGGPSYAYAGLLYEGQAYQRCLTVAQFLTSTAPSFYIIGTDDQISGSIPLPSTYWGKILINTPSDVPDPSTLAYRLTYQVYGATSANDLTVATSEYLIPGSFQINYLSS